MRKNSQILICAAIALAIGWLGLLRTESTNSVQTTATELTYEEPRSPLLPKARESKLESRESLELSQACVQYWRALRNIDLSELISFPPTLTAFPKAGDCKLSKLPPALRGPHIRFAKACEGYEKNNSKHSDARTWLKENRNCHAAAVTYRAHMTNYLTRNELTEHLKDPKILEDKLLVSLETADPKETLENANRLLELVPENPQALEAKIMALYQQAVELGSNSPEHETWKRLHHAISDFSEIHPNAVETHLNIALLSHYMRYGNATQLRNRAHEALQQHDNCHIPYHYLALAAFAEGDTESAIAFERKFARLSGDPAATQTIKRIQNGDPQPFRMGISTSLSLYRAEVE